MSTYKGKSRGGRGMRGGSRTVKQFSAVGWPVTLKPGREGEYLKAFGSTTPEKQARRARLADQARTTRSEDQ